MANYNANKQENGDCFNQYVNFNQFLMQHNIGNTSPFYSPQNVNFGYSSYGNYQNSQQIQPFNTNPQQQQQQQSSPNGNYYPSSSSSSSLDVIQNSNLTVTATEFIPQKVTQSNLIASADVFVPKSRANNENTEAPESTNDSEATCSKKKPTRNEYDDRNGANSIADKLNKTHITDGRNNGDRIALDSSGGAIKKVRNHRNDSGDRQSIGNRNNRGGYNKRQMDNRYEDRFDDRRRRNYRENDRYNNGRSSAKYDKYDNNRNYRNNKSDNYDETHGAHKTNRNGHKSGYANQKADSPENESSSKPSHHHKRNEKQDPKERRRDEMKFSRNMKFNSFRFDSTNGPTMNQREKLTREIDAGKLECLVCCEMIKPFHSTWSCSNCFHIMHLNCIVKWAASSKSDEGWRCCACQNISKIVPSEYYCFCGKTKDPQYNRNDTAHTCGELCGRIDSCPHPCSHLCHPGPCPTCQVMVTRVCGCGKTSKIFQCNQKNDLKCDQMCEKRLNCTRHSCEKSCHFDECDVCDKEIEQTCYCKRDKRTVPCTMENNEQLLYSCGRICNRQLKCKNHKCKEPCHAGECGDCKLVPDLIKTCPCGKMVLEKDQRKTCKDPIPVCTAVCKKPLTCGQPGNPHTCPSKCHVGPCPPCNKQTSVKCRCGHMDQMIKCTQLQTRADDARCKKRCTKKRNCGKHKCNQECCIDIDHVCPMKCTYTLSCGKHKCDSNCHKGRCLPCYRSSFDELYCECGANVIYPPVPCGTKRPACDKPCSRAHPCDHPITHNCHSAQNCPPCMAFTTKYCHGKHEQRKIIPCSTESFSCGMSCNKPLKCGKHRCQKTCHAGICETDTDICKQNCTKARIMCPHKCNAPCHEGSECPDIPCRETVEVLCQCGIRKQMRTCHDFSSEFRKIATANFASSMQQMQNGGTIELSDVLGPIKTTNNKTLDCNEECRVAERNKRLAIGLQIRNPDNASKFQPKYSEFIRGWAKKDPKLVTMIHDKLTELVKLAKDSKQRSRSYSFPTMNREKRQLVHEMCEMFGVESVAYDAEPNRNVVATAKRDTSWLPSMSIMEMIQRENGQRRIPLPSLNAWGIKRN